MGRPKEDLYEKYVIGREEAIKAAAKKGATNENLATLLGCGLTTIKKLKKDYPLFADLLKTGREIADNLVENALFKRATGYDYEEVVTEVRLNHDGTGQTTFVKKTRKHVPPETAAALAWLFNRRPKDWTNKSYTKDKPEDERKPPKLLTAKELKELHERLEQEY